MVELQGGFPLLIQQYRALLRKNLLLSWRNKRSTFIQLFVSFFFILLMFGIEKTINIAPKSVLDPQPLIAPPIPRCEEKHFMMSPCFDLVWSGNHSSQRIQSIVRGIMVNNPGRPIPDHKVKSFGTPEEIDDWASKNLRHSFGSLHFVERNSTVISYGIQTNSSSESWRGGHEDATFQFQLPLQIAAEREIARSLIGDPNFRWVVGFKEFPHRGEKSFSLTGALLPTFFFAIAMFGFVFQIASLIVEKELKLRQAMTMMGLYETSYWLSWLTWETLLVLISSLLTVLFGVMFQFNFFLQNSFIILFLLFFLFQLNMIGYAFMLSNFIGKVSSATTLGFFIFIIGFITQLVTTLASLYSSEVKARYRYMWSLFPPNLLAKALQLLGDAIDPENRQHKGINWQNRAQCLDGCVITMDGIYKWLIATFVVWFLLAIYLDNIFQNSSGVRKPLFYFLNLGYWTGKDENKVKEGGICSCGRSIPPMEDVTPADEDVREEEGVVKQQVAEGVVDPNVAVQLRGLAKTYPGARNIVCCAGCCCKCTRTPTYHAVKGLWVNFAKDQLFCLLGPNGAGKTTAISCLTGIAPVTSGDAFIYGHSVRSSVGMANIRRIIGVCPQFDILWDALTGEEHLHLFASIKGLPSSLIESVTKNSLAEVRLTDAAKLRSGSYSGGMKRRLSVAIALIGDPKLVILDEPTTGMDPITRRHVWDIIENAKRGRAILLTTHSMEEADILGDRIAIMAKGKLRCIGTSVRLKSRFGAGFISNVTFHQNTPGQTQIGDRDSVPSSDIYQEAVKQFFKEYLNVTPKETSKKMLTYVIPHQKEELLTNFFAELQYREREFGISDIQLGLTTLEEVFLNIAKKAELESAVAEGTMVTLTLISGVSLEIPKGARFIGIPGTETTEHPRGLMVEVYWDQDDKGTLCISGHSSETPIPPNARTMESSASISQRGRVGRNRTVRGLVFNPDDIEGPNQ